jgi:hypothetical protein
LVTLKSGCGDSRRGGKPEEIVGHKLNAVTDSDAKAFTVKALHSAVVDDGIAFKTSF